MICRQWLGWMVMLLLLVINILDCIFIQGRMKCMIQKGKVLVDPPSLTRRKIWQM